MEKSKNRREFLVQAGTISAGVCFFGTSAFLSACSASKSAGSSAVSFTETADQLSIPAATFSEKNSQILHTKKYEEPLYVSKQPDGTYAALRMYCPHKGCEVNAASDRFVCPCHGSEFALDGALLKGPSKSPLQSFPVTLDQDQVIVHFK